MPLLLIFVLACVCLVSCDSQPKTIFLLGGQSNMSGRGGVNYNGTHTWDGIVPPECQPNPSILKLDVNLNWVEAREPLHKDIDVLDPLENATHGIGPGIPFAHAILKTRPNFGLIGLVPCAHQRSNMSQWERGSTFYNLMITRAEASIKNGGVIGGLLWWQGGADSMNQAQVDSFYNNTVKFFNDVRTDLKSPELPILQVLIPYDPSGAKPLTQQIRQVQKSIQLPNMKTVDSTQFELGPDKVHLTTQGEVMIGAELAKEYLTLNQ